MAAVIQRPLRGSRISTFYPVKNLPSLASLDSAFQLQEYISLLIRLDVHDVDAIVSLPGSSSKDFHATNDGKEDHAENTKDGDAERKNEVTVDEACWIYEQLRRLAQDLSHPLITTLQQECTRASCPAMKAGEWQYLCVAHGNDGAMEQCCAIDYILHTVDSATALLNSPRTFPSRLQIPQTSHRHFPSLARRLGRIFAHAYFHHREAFEQAEAESSLYARFLALTAKFDLVPPEFLVIPPAQFLGEDSGSVHERDLPRGYPDSRQHYPPQLREEDHNLLAAPHVGQKYIQQQQLGVGRTRSPNISGPAEGGINGGIGENPTLASKLRLGRSRTDTMIFAEAEMNAFTDELAAKARASGPDVEEEHEGPKTARPSVEVVEDSDEVDIQPTTEGDTHFEISLSPDEETVSSAGDVPSLTTVPHSEPKQEEPEKDIAATSSIPTEPAPTSEAESAPVESEKPEKFEESVPYAVVPEPEREEESAPEIPSTEEVKAPESPVEIAASESEPAPALSFVPEPETKANSESQEAPVPEATAKEIEAKVDHEPLAPVIATSVEETALPTESDVTEAPVSPTHPVASPAQEESSAETLTPETAVAESTPESVPAATPATTMGEDTAELTIEETPTFAADPLATVIQSSAIKPLEAETAPSEDPLKVDDASALPANDELHPTATD